MDHQRELGDHWDPFICRQDNPKSEENLKYTNPLKKLTSEINARVTAWLVKPQPTVQRHLPQCRRTGLPRSKVTGPDQLPGFRNPEDESVLTGSFLYLLGS